MLYSEICHLEVALGWALGYGLDSAIYQYCSDLSPLPSALGLGSLNVELLTLGQLFTYPLLEFEDLLNQVGPPWRERGSPSPEHVC